jgi:spore coat protein A
MGINRRSFIKSGIAGAAALSSSYRLAWGYGQSPTGVRKFTQPLAGLAAQGIPVSSPTNNVAADGFELHKINIGKSTHVFHPDLYPRGSAGTRIWGYNPANNATPAYLGGVIVATQGTPTRIRFTNQLPNRHPLPVDDTLSLPPEIPSESNVPGAQQHNRTAVHMHGGLLDWTSDGGPFDWFTPNGNFGPSLGGYLDPNFKSPIRYDSNGNRLAGNQVEVYMPNQQSARFAWYHDHAVGITRLNAYAGIASAYLITDAVEQALIDQKVLPTSPVLGVAYPLGIPLVIQDKTFVNQAALDQGYPVSDARPGDLFYPYVYEKNVDSNGQLNPKGRWDWGPTAGGDPAAQEPPPISVVPEFYSDTTVINGVAYPFLPVEQRHYRFRMLNGSQARFYNLMLFFEDPANAGEVRVSVQRDPQTGLIASVTPIGKPGPALVQIGTEGGWLDFPVLLNDPPLPCQIDIDPETGAFLPTSRYNLLLGPGERADVIVDFSNVPVGSKLILYNDAPSPFPSGDSRNDYFTGCDDQRSIGGVGTVRPGVGPNTRTLMQFQVTARAGAPDPASMGILEGLARNGAQGGQSEYVAMMGLPAAINLKTAARIRNLTLNEDFDRFGRLVQKLGTDVLPPNANWCGRDYDSTPTEIIKNGTTEIWRIYNTTGDTHPMHFHLVNVRVLTRRQFTYTFDSNGKLVPTLGVPRPADRNERGEKETVRMNPGEMIELLIKFDLPKNLPFKVPFSPRLKKYADASGHALQGYEYVWHCHILEHEEHDMMRPLVIVP